MASLTIISLVFGTLQVFLIKVTFEVSPLYSLELRCYSWCRVTEAWPQPNTQARRRRQRELSFVEANMASCGDSGGGGGNLFKHVCDC